MRHLLKDCSECPRAENEKLYAKRAEELAHDGPSKSTRAQKTKVEVSEGPVALMGVE